MTSNVVRFHSLNPDESNTALKRPPQTQTGTTCYANDAPTSIVFDAQFTEARFDGVAHEACIWGASSNPQRLVPGFCVSALQVAPFCAVVGKDLAQPNAAQRVVAPATLRHGVSLYQL